MANDWNKYRNQLTRAREDELERKDRKRRNNPALMTRKSPGDPDLDQAEPGPAVRKVRSKQMSLAEVNALILAFRDGDKKAETKLYFRYIRRIKMLMKKSPWYDEIKDSESLAMDIWMKLCEWFQENTIEKGEGAVLSNRVRGMCRDQARKDMNEPSAEIEQADQGDSEKNPPAATIRETLALWVTQRDVFPGFSTKRFREAELNMQVSLRKIIGKCLKTIEDTHREALDRIIFLGEKATQICVEFKVGEAEIRRRKRLGLMSLLLCLESHGVESVGDLL